MERKEIDNIINSIHEKLNINIEQPVDILNIFRSFGFAVKAIPDDDKYMDYAIGAYLKEPSSNKDSIDPKFVCFKRATNKIRRKTYLSYLLGLYMLHRDALTVDDKFAYSLKDTNVFKFDDALYFAVNLVIPTDSFVKLGGNEEAYLDDYLANQFEVTVFFIQKKREYLKNSDKQLPKAKADRAQKNDDVFNKIINEPSYSEIKEDFDKYDRRRQKRQTILFVALLSIMGVSFGVIIFLIFYSAFCSINNVALISSLIGLMGTFISSIFALLNIITKNLFPSNEFNKRIDQVNEANKTVAPKTDGSVLGSDNVIKNK